MSGGGDWIWGRVDPDRLKLSEGLAVALHVAVQCSEKLDFDIVWPKIKLLLRPYASLTIGLRHISLGL
jgi:hypothetical protein